MPEHDVAVHLPDLGPRAELTDAERTHLMRRPVASGAGRPPADLGTTEVARLNALLYRGPSRKKLPKWVLAHVERRATPDEFLATLASRVKRAPNQANLEAAETYVNDLARRDGLPAALRHIDDAFVQRVRGGEG